MSEQVMAEPDQTSRWMTAARRGDPVALAKLLATFHPRLRARVEARMEAALKAKSEPEDILQETYLEVFRRIDGFQDRGPDAFVNWVLTILDHKLIDARRALHRRVRDVDREVPAMPPGATQSYWNLLDHLYADTNTPSRAVRKDEAVTALQACIAQLSESHEEIIRLRFLEGRTVGEVAGLIDKTEAAVVALTKRALGALRTAMERLGDFTRGV